MWAQPAPRRPERPDFGRLRELVGCLLEFTGCFLSAAVILLVAGTCVMGAHFLVWLGR